ncbi:hypothetical protein PVAP13_3KG387600 [Panicum virgatum]|uniref:Uncharacterized protein n=1 Tax=Panicum virgatum TaxID=38727 RepID=A0A8T0V6T5_PANVG|nr:hypothetical protein PVAP13_3KG387600 [Panicum virgatum]
MPTQGRAPAAADEHRSSGGASQLPEQNVAGVYGAATPPTSFVNESCFFNGHGSFFSSAGRSPIAKPWMQPQYSDSATWATNFGPSVQQEQDHCTFEVSARASTFEVTAQNCGHVPKPTVASTFECELMAMCAVAIPV